MILRLVILALLAASPAWAAVAFDNTATTSGTSVTSLTTPAFTITAAANRAGLLALGTEGNNASAISGSIGGVSGSAIAGTDSGTTDVLRTLMFGVTAPPSGSQTATMSWTTAQTGAKLGVVTASGVGQTTPFNNGTFNNNPSSDPATVTITSTNGDLTCDNQANNTAIGTPNQTQRWGEIVSVTAFGGSTGPGTGTTTHTWTLGAAASWVSSGANFVQSGAAAAVPLRTLMGVGQ